MIAWHNATDERMYVNVDGDKKASMCRYYKLKIFSDEKRKLIADRTQEIAKREAQKIVDAIGFEVYENTRRQSLRADFERVARKSIKGDKL